MRSLAFCLLAAAACGGDPSHTIADAQPADAPDAAPPCAPTTVVGTHAGNITADETWATGVHEVTGTVTVRGGTLTIAACTEVRLAPNASIEVTTGTALVAQGTDAAPIRFVRDNAAQPWGHVSAIAPATLTLAHATLVGGGTAGDYTTADQLGSTITVRGSAALPALLSVDHVTVDGASGIGVFMNAARFMPASTALTITRSGFYPILLGADSANELPDGAYTGNNADAILLQSAGTAAAYEQGRTLLADVTLHDRGVPYQVGVKPTVIVVGDGLNGSPSEKLTIEAGVTVKFVPQGTSNTSRLQVRGHADGTGQGALVAIGTAAKPITFTSSSATPTAGDWQGLEFRNAVSAATSVDHAVIRYAGGASFSVGVCESDPASHVLKEDSAVLISLAPNIVPPAFLTNTAISDSANAGVYRGWSVSAIDFTASNTFTNVVGCLQSNVPNASNACPTTTCPIN